MLLAFVVFAVSACAAAAAPAKVKTNTRALSSLEEANTQLKLAKAAAKTSKQAVRAAKDNQRVAERAERQRRQLSGHVNHISGGICQTVTITNDAEAEAAAECTHAVGPLTISGTFTKNFKSKLRSADDLLDCQNGCAHWTFPHLEAVMSLKLSDPSLVEVKDMFPDLTSITYGDLEVTSCGNLELIDDFHELKFIWYDHWVHENPVLRHIHGFENLVTVGEEFYINNNDMLETIPGYDKLINIAYDFYIYENAKLKNIDGFNELVNCPWGFEIYLNDKVETIKGFNKLSSQAEDPIQIYSNPSLKIIDGFNGLLWLYDVDIEIYDNANLRNIKGFNAEGMFFDGDITIYDNPMLEEIDVFHNVVGLEDISIYDNAELKKISGFHQVLTAEVDFYNNPKLTVIDGFKSLQNSWSLVLQDLPSLREAKFESLMQVDGDVQIHGVRGLAFPGPGPGPGIGRQLRSDTSSDEASNDSEDSSDDTKGVSFGKLTTLHELNVSNSDYQSLQEFGTLRYVEDSITIISNNLLKNLDGLGGISSDDVHSISELSINSNAELQDLDGVAHFTHVGAIEFGTDPDDSTAGPNGPGITRSIVEQAFGGMTADSATFELDDGSSASCSSCDFAANGVFDLLVT